MLVLTRKVGQQIQIGDDIIVKVIGFKYGQAQLGIDAPPDVRVLRHEVVERKEDQDTEDHVQNPRVFYKLKKRERY